MGPMRVVCQMCFLQLAANLGHGPPYFSQTGPFWLLRNIQNASRSTGEFACGFDVCVCVFDEKSMVRASAISLRRLHSNEARPVCFQGRRPCLDGIQQNCKATDFDSRWMSGFASVNLNCCGTGIPVLVIMEPGFLGLSCRFPSSAIWMLMRVPEFAEWSPFQRFPLQMFVQFELFGLLCAMYPSCWYGFLRRESPCSGLLTFRS